MKIRLRRGTAAQWAARNPVLAAGEMGFETDTGIVRVGNGTTAYLSLQPLATRVIGPLGDVNAVRLTLYAEATGQVANLMESYSGTDTGQGGQRQLTSYLNEKGERRVIAARFDSVPDRIKAQPGQTANLTEWTTTGNVPGAWVGPDFLIRGPNLGHVLAVSVVGNIAGGSVGAHRVYNDTGVTLTIRSVRASLGTAPTGQAAIVDVNRNGATIFTTQANRPSIAAGTNTSGKVTTMDVTTLADGDFVTVDVDQAGSGTVGADLVVQLLAY